MTRQLNPGIIAYNNINSITLEEEKVVPTSKGLLSPKSSNSKGKAIMLDETIFIYLIESFIYICFAK